MGQPAGGFRFLDPRVRKNRSGHVTLPLSTITISFERVRQQQQQTMKIRNALTFKRKASIVKEAYSRPRNMKPTARKYKVDPSNIRRWKKNLEAIYAQFPGEKEQIPAQ